MSRANELRKRLVEAALEWERYFGVAPSITSAISELDAAQLVGMKERDYCAEGQNRTAVTKDADFTVKTSPADVGIRYQVTANRPSGKKGSAVTLVKQKTEKRRPFGWDRLIWILYDRSYEIREAREFTVGQYRTNFGLANRLSPDDMRKGRPMSLLTDWK